MRIVDNWQYRYIEKCLYNYYKLAASNLDTEIVMHRAIGLALDFFKNTPHETMLIEFYFNADHHRRRLTNSGHYRWVCQELLFTEEPNGYVIRREIVYRVAMMCYGLGLFRVHT